MLIDDDIDDIITRGESRTVELSQKYETLNLEDLTNFKSEMTVQNWEGENFAGKVRIFIPEFVSNPSLTLAVSANKLVWIGLSPLDVNEKGAATL